MISRRRLRQVQAALARQPGVVLLGPRQVGKTTLAHAIAEGRPSTYLDLESADDRARLSDPAAFLALHTGELVVLDEIHRVPELFPTLRGVIDAGRRKGLRTGRFLLLGSASLDLMKQSSESLAGRVTYEELGPLDVLETGRERTDALWLRGGFPESLLASDDRASFEWRTDFIRTYLERDVAQFGARIPAETLRRLWTMLAHEQGGLLNASRLAASLGVSAPTVGRYLDLLVDLLLVRRLEPVFPNVGKRLTKSPRLYVRDSGLVHALLGLGTMDALLGHPVAGASWEGSVIEQAIGAAPDGTIPGFFRTAAGAEIDLVLDLPGGHRWVVEVKRGAAPSVGRGFHEARKDLAPERSLVVHSGPDRFPMREGIEALPLHALLADLAALSEPPSNAPSES